LRLDLMDVENRAEWRRRTRVADPSPEGFNPAWRRERVVGIASSCFVLGLEWLGFGLSKPCVGVGLFQITVDNGHWTVVLCWHVLYLFMNIHSDLKDTREDPEEDGLMILKIGHDWRLKTRAKESETGQWRELVHSVVNPSIYEWHMTWHGSIFNSTKQIPLNDASSIVCLFH